MAIGSNICVMAISAYSIIFGLDLAIRGQEGSMSRAVKNLYDERHFVLRLFWTAVGFTSLSGIALAWVKLKTNPRWSVISTFILFAMAIVVYIQFRVRERFKFPEHTHKKPDEFLFNDRFDPEQAQVMQGHGGRGRAPSP